MARAFALGRQWIGAEAHDSLPGKVHGRRVTGVRGHEREDDGRCVAFPGQRDTLVERTSAVASEDDDCVRRLGRIQVGEDEEPERQRHEGQDQDGSDHRHSETASSSDAPPRPPRRSADPAACPECARRSGFG